jgi:hypothetical protein
MYNLRNKVRNLTSFNIYCAYSGPSDGGGYDSWHVSILKAGYESDYVDIDFVETVDDHHFLSDGGYQDGRRRNRTFKTNSWAKVPPFTTTTISADLDNGKIGNMTVATTVFRTPMDVMDDAKQFDGTWFEDSRGTQAMKRAIFEWDDIIAARKLTPLKQRAAY